MISWSRINELQDEKLALQIKLNELLNTPNNSKDEINELRSDLKHLDSQITKILGSNEINRQEELKRKKLGIDERNKKNFYVLKDKYKKISKMKLATTKMLFTIEALNKNAIIENEKIKVR